MQHIDEDTLILHHYGEAERPREVRAHLQWCPDCRERLRRLTEDLERIDALPDAEPGPGYPSQVWLRLRPQLEPLAHTGVSPGRRRWLRMAAAAALVMVGFLAGMLWRQTRPAALQAEAGAVRRVYLAAIGQHLARTQVLLLEVRNAPGGGDDVLAADVPRAAQLLADNRIYRLTAAENDDPRLAVLLEELERVLLEIANRGGALPPEDLDALQQRIDSQSLLFKTKAVGERLAQDLGNDRPMQL